MGNKNSNEILQKEMLEKFDLIKEGEKNEYAGCKIVCNGAKRS